MEAPETSLDLESVRTLSEDWRPVAFKEWEVVIDAIAKGEQTVLLRKGGISEGRAGFQWLHPQFFLYPSRFHEQVDQVRPQTDGKPRFLAPDSGRLEKVDFRIWIETIETGRLADWEQVCAWEPWHIWKRSTVRDRFEWGDEPGISYAKIRAWKLPQPWLLDDRKSFGGCRSWFGLPASEGGDWRSQLAEATPVQSDLGWPGS
ncbi:MAG: DUF1802 family protein [Verrucomicrobiota bacterium]